MKHNPYPDNSIDFLMLKEGYGHKVLLNGSTVKALISGRSMTRDNGERIIRTLSPLKTGDFVLWQRKTWLVMGNVSVSRYGVYRADMRPCEPKEDSIKG